MAEEHEAGTDGKTRCAADLAALAAAGLTRFAEGRLEDLGVLERVTAAACEAVRTTMRDRHTTHQWTSLEDAIARLKRELRR